MPTASTKPRTNATPKRSASDRRRRGRAGGSPRSRRARGARPAPHRRRARWSAPGSAPGSWLGAPRTLGGCAGPAPGDALDERRELGSPAGVASSSVACIGNPVGCRFGHVGHQLLMRGRPVPGPRPRRGDIFACAREFVMCGCCEPPSDAPSGDVRLWQRTGDPASVQAVDNAAPQGPPPYGRLMTRLLPLLAPCVRGREPDGCGTVPPRRPRARCL